MITLTLLPHALAVCKLGPNELAWQVFAHAPFWSVTRTAEELSLVLPEEYAQATWQVEGGWRALGVVGPLDFALVGILAALAQPLAEAGIPIFAISTYDTDYLLVKKDKLAAAVAALRDAGHAINEQ